jgi:hypothetical protein
VASLPVWFSVTRMSRSASQHKMTWVRSSPLKPRNQAAPHPSGALPRCPATRHETTKPQIKPTLKLARGLAVVA